MDYENLSENTKQAYKQGLKHWREYRQGREITPGLCEGFTRYLEDKGLAQRSQHLYLTAVIRHLQEQLDGEGVLSGPEYGERTRAITPLRDKQGDLDLSPFEPDLPTKENISRILAYLENTKSPTLAYKLMALRDRALFKVSLCTGLRVSELCNISLADVSLDDREIEVTVKGGKSETVIIAPQAAEAINDYLAVRKELDKRQDTPRTSLPLFARHDKKASRNILYMSSRSIEKIFNQLGRVGGCETSLTPHKIRHYTATNMLTKSGGDAFLVGHALAHSQLMTTKGYVHTPKSASIEKLKSLGDALLTP